MNIRLSTPRLRPAVGLLTVASLLFAASCTAPRAIVATGKVTPQGEFRVGYNQGYNIATAPIAKAGTAVIDAARTASKKDTVGYGGAVKNLQAAALGYLLDPVQSTADVHIRYGIVPGLDAGFKYAFGSYVFDAQYQFLGPTGSVENPGSARGGTTYGSVGLQFATQRAKLPSSPFLADLNSFLNLKATRRDLIIPLIFSNSFGPEEQFGAISYGVAYAHSWVSYSFAPDNVYLNNRLLPELPNQRRNFSSFGGFLNLKLGYKYVYVIPAMSVFYQNYGDYALLNNESTSLSGLTFVPSIGFQARIPTKRSGR